MFPASLQHWIGVPALVTFTEKIAGLSISLNQTGFREIFVRTNPFCTRNTS